MTIYLTELSSQDFHFPSPHLALEEPNGLLAFGGDLHPCRVLNAYSQGIFPWYGPDEPILWWSPSPRAVFYPNAFSPTRSLKKFQRKNQYRITLNHATKQVIQQCAAVRPAEQTWLNDEMQQTYSTLANQGHCHSVEVWQGNQLIGGLYGILRGQLFCGESMFSLKSNASKIALWYFCDYFSQQGGALIDCQVMNPHLESLGAQLLSREAFLEQLDSLKSKNLTFSAMQPQILEVLL